MQLFNGGQLAENFLNELASEPELGQLTRQLGHGRRATRQIVPGERCQLHLKQPPQRLNLPVQRRDAPAGVGRERVQAREGNDGRVVDIHRLIGGNEGLYVYDRLCREARDRRGLRTGYRLCRCPRLETLRIGRPLRSRSGGDGHPVRVDRRKHRAADRASRAALGRREGRCGTVGGRRLVRSHGQLDLPFDATRRQNDDIWTEFIADLGKSGSHVGGDVATNVHVGSALSTDRAD